MLSFKFVTSSGGAAHYFENTDDYYSKDGPKGLWEGKGAELLGLTGAVDSKAFKNLLEGKLPNGEQVRKSVAKLQGDGKVSKARLGIDFTFSAPKSVSIAALVNQDRDIIKAHDEAVKSAIAFLEGKAIARHKVGALSFRQHTGNLTVATFRHDLSRTKDPQLHTHAVTMNLTRREDGRWVALTNDEMLKAVKTAGAYYRAALAEKLQEMGYGVRATRHGFELENVSDKAIKLFSKRSRQIEDALKERGTNRDSASTEQKQMVTQATRPVKSDADRDELRKQWIELLNQAGLKVEPSRTSEIIEKVKEVAQEFGKSVTPAFVRQHFEDRRQEKDKLREAEAVERNKVRATEAVDYAIEHLMERQGIFTMSEIRERAYSRALGNIAAIEREIVVAQQDGRLIAELPLYQSAKSFNREQDAKERDSQHDKFRDLDLDLDKLTKASWVAMAMAKSGLSQADAEHLVEQSIQSGRLVRAEERFTTGEMLGAERKILSMEEVGRGVVAPIKLADDVTKMFKDSNLNPGQRDAAALILTTSNRFVGIQGYAGVGKSHMMSAAVDAIKAEAVKGAAQQGFEVIGLAPYTSQNAALAELGMKSQTLASFLTRPADQAKLNDKAIVFLDEASVVPAHQMRDLMELIEKSNSRLVLIGDRKQTQAVEAGKPFEQLQDQGMSVAHITEIQRQQNVELKSAVVSAAAGRITEAVNKLQSRTIEIENADDRYAALAKDYTALSSEEQDKTLIVAGTNAARQSINAMVRDGLGLAGGREVATLDSVDMTRAEKKVAGHYSPDQVLMFEGKAKGGLERNTQYVVVGVDNEKNELTVRSPAGQLAKVDPSQHRAISVFEKSQLTLTAGDLVRITRNHTNLGLANGLRVKVAQVTDTAVTLSNGVELPRSAPLHMQYGYATTVHGAQGLTQNRVLIEADTKSLTSNRAVFYVAISRPKHELKIYTDARAAVAKVMQREPKKYAALELRGSDLEKRAATAALQRQALATAMRVNNAPVVKRARQL